MEISRTQEEKPLSNQEMMLCIARVRPDMAEKLRMLEAKASFLKEKNVYGELYSDRQVGICFDAIFRAAYTRCRILELTQDRARSVREIARMLGKTPKSTLFEVVELRRKNLIGIERIDDRVPLYKASVI